MFITLLVPVEYATAQNIFSLGLQHAPNQLLLSLLLARAVQVIPFEDVIMRLVPVSVETAKKRDSCGLQQTETQPLDRHVRSVQEIPSVLVITLFVPL